MASALIGVLPIVASVLLLQVNRDLLTGHGVAASMLQEMRMLVASQPGVVDVPDLFAVVVGPLSVIVDEDVTFSNVLDVPAVERAIASAGNALRKRFPSIQYLYLTPVPEKRPRRISRA
jgi:divalent metal cation (Fe/Co/Zn/Cd) transporter